MWGSKRVAKALPVTDTSAISFPSSSSRSYCLPARFPLASPHSARVDPETPPRLPPLAQ